ncbi:nucleotidyltransferase family protein [Parapedobacter lycopersici]|uniref:nucleotidyltransferase family protein n=1 Tax=Parapedobacter lycopersici TaxID=1864939 RepID=UPI00214DE09C|nr:nucleotidyltransferase family protein [Parapedobacter lycopersici]
MIDLRLQEIIKETTAKYQPSLIGVFGSYARGEQNNRSDLDILIDFNHRVNLLELIHLEAELSKRLGIKVDLVTAKSLHQHLKPLIERDLIRIT